MKTELIIPAYNEEKVLEKNIIFLINFLRDKNLTERVKIIIVDNNSSDRTKEIGEKMKNSNLDIEYLRLEKKGKGLAIKSGWEKFQSDIYGFMDADLSTDLEALPKAIELIEKGNDFVFGSRFAKGAKVERSFFRKFISRVYGLCLRILFNFKGDASCGFKFISSSVAKEVLPKVRDNQFFFDTELLLLTKHFNYKIYELPVSWSEKKEQNRKSTVNIVPTIIAYLKNIFSLRKRLKNTKDCIS